MNYQEMTKTFTAKAAKCRSLWEVELCLKDIRDTLEIWHGEMMIETLNGNSVNNLYVQKLLCERDAYLARYDQLKRKMEKA
jgi:hypothetical protein